MNTENKMKKIVIIAGVVIIFLLAAPYLYKVLFVWGGVGDMGLHGVFRRRRSIE